MDAAVNFLCNLGQHSLKGQRSLEDVIGIIGHQLRALGHNIVWEPGNTQLLRWPTGYNLIVEGFNDGVIEGLATAHAQGARFVCVATEEPTSRGFNHGTQPEMMKRQEAFPRAAPYLDAIWHLVPGERVTAWYAQFAPAAYVELGYAPTLVRFDESRQAAYHLIGLREPEPEYDFGFYGTISRRRERLLKKLANKIGSRKAVRVVGDFATQADRDKAMREAKVIVQIRKFDEMGLVSSSRCNTALCLGRPVVAEPHELCKPWDEVVKFATTDVGFLDLAVATRGMWRGVHAWQFAKFKEKFPPEACVGAALRLLTEARRAA